MRRLCAAADPKRVIFGPVVALGSWFDPVYRALMFRTVTYMDNILIDNDDNESCYAHIIIIIMK